MKNIKISLLFVFITILFISCSDNKEIIKKEVVEEKIEIVKEEKETIKPENYFLFDDTRYQSKDNHISIIAVGDIMAHTINFDSARIESGYDFYPQFEYITDKISSKDFAVGNLETTLSGEDKRYSGRNMVFNAPDNLAESIKKAGFDILFTANNHSLDRRFYGLKRTIDILDGLGLKHTGTYKTLEDRDELLIVEKNNVKIAFLSYTYGTNGIPLPKEAPFSVNLIEENKMREDIKKARDLADFVVVGMHWGLEYYLNESVHQRRKAAIAFDEGADIVLGGHPHVLQPFEHFKMKDQSGRYKDKFIIYSMGNFISGQRTYPRAIGMYINFDIINNNGNKYINEVTVMPTYVEKKIKEGKLYMRILDMRKAIEDYEKNTLDITDALYNELIKYEKTFVNHLFSRVNIEPILNDNKEYIIYRK